MRPETRPNGILMEDSKHVVLLITVAVMVTLIDLRAKQNVSNTVEWLVRTNSSIFV